MERLELGHRLQQSGKGFVVQRIARTKRRQARTIELSRPREGREPHPRPDSRPDSRTGEGPLSQFMHKMFMQVAPAVKQSEGDR